MRWLSSLLLLFWCESITSNYVTINYSSDFDVDDTPRQFLCNIPTEITKVGLIVVNNNQEKNNHGTKYGCQCIATINDENDATVTIYRKSSIDNLHILYNITTRRTEFTIQEQSLHFSQLSSILIHNVHVQFTPSTTGTETSWTLQCRPIEITQSGSDLPLSSSTKLQPPLESTTTTIQREFPIATTNYHNKPLTYRAVTKYRSKIDIITSPMTPMYQNNHKLPVTIGAICVIVTILICTIAIIIVTVNKVQKSKLSSSGKQSLPNNTNQLDKFASVHSMQYIPSKSGWRKSTLDKECSNEQTEYADINLQLLAPKQFMEDQEENTSHRVDYVVLDFHKSKT